MSEVMMEDLPTPSHPKPRQLADHSDTSSRSHASSPSPTRTIRTRSRLGMVRTGLGVAEGSVIHSAVNGRHVTPCRKVQSMGELELWSWKRES